MRSLYEKLNTNWRKFGVLELNVTTIVAVRWYDCDGELFVIIYTGCNQHTLYEDDDDGYNEFKTWWEG